MRIVALMGSPRSKKGNSATIAKRFCNMAETLGAEVKIYKLNKLEYRGCQACMSCKTKLDKCALKDDLTEVLDAVRDADILLLASPIYYGDVSSQLKAFIDRTYSYLVPDYPTNPNPCRLPPGKKLLFVLTQGHPDESMFADVFPRYDFFFKWYGFSESQLIRACGVQESGEVVARPEVMKLAEDLAGKLCNRG
jgi:multimeric flavodoxin WrbA